MTKTISLSEAIRLKNSGVKITTETGEEWSPPDLTSLVLKLIDEIIKLNSRASEKPPHVNVAAPSVNVAAPQVSLMPQVTVMPADVKIATANKWKFKINRNNSGFIESITAERID